MWILVLIGIPLAAGLGALGIGRISRVGRPWILAAPALAAFGLVLWGGNAAFAGNLAAGVSWSWFDSLGVTFQFQLTGLGWLLALLVSGIGTLILLYAGEYMEGNAQARRLFLYLYLFMFAMLGLAFADNLILLFIFWELTSVISYLLISFKHEDATARRNALQGLLITGLGGMALLAGFILMAQAGGSWSVSGLVGRAQDIQGHAHYPFILGLVLAGAFTKSAQVPLHLWLPNAMSAPTPVSAYLHSATMVKAGVFLLALLHPILGGTLPWTVTLCLAGGATLLHGSVLGLVHHDMKKILAGTTVAVLGLLIFLIGLGTPAALQAAAMFFIAHALYKAALFLVAGNVDHATGTRDVEKLGGLRRWMPWTALAAAMAAFSKMGLPPFWGFLGKEYTYKAGLDVTQSTGATALLFLGSGLLFALAIKVAIAPFWFSGKGEMPKSPHEAGIAMRWPPLILGLSGLATGLLPGLLVTPVNRAVETMLAAPYEGKILLWQGFNLPLLLSLLTVAAGIGIYALATRPGVASRLRYVPLGDRLYDRCFDAVLALAKGQTRFLQSGYLRNYLLIILATTCLLVLVKLWRFGGWPTFTLPSETSPLLLAACGVLLASIWGAVAARSRIVALIALGGLGYGVAGIFALFGAPDLAITQILVETLTVVLFAWVIYRLPDYRGLSSRPARWLDGGIAVASGLVLTLLVLKAQTIEIGVPISEQLIRWSLPEAYGANVVNVILVDFRALDTFGEIIVVAIAALGVFALLKSKKSASR